MVLCYPFAPRLYRVFASANRMRLLQNDVRHARKKRSDVSKILDPALRLGVLAVSGMYLTETMCYPGFSPAVEMWDTTTKKKKGSIP